MCPPWPHSSSVRADVTQYDSAPAAGLSVPAGALRVTVGRMKVMTDSTQTDSTGTDSTGAAWKEAGEYADIRYETSPEGIAKITICRPEVHNAFRPQTIIEISAALTVAREDT